MHSRKSALCIKKINTSNTSVNLCFIVYSPLYKMYVFVKPWPKIVKHSQNSLLYLTVKNNIRWTEQKDMGYSIMFNQGDHHQSYFFNIKIYQKYLIHSLGLTLSTPGLV